MGEQCSTEIASPDTTEGELLAEGLLLCGAEIYGAIRARSEWCLLEFDILVGDGGIAWS